MLLRYLHNPDVVVLLVVSLVVLALVAIIAWSHVNARMEFLLGLDKNSPRKGPGERENSRNFPDEKSSEHSELPTPRHLGF